MQVYYKRCKHCNTEYTYRINGSRYGMSDYTSDYCPECQSAIYEALAKIEKKYEPRLLKINISIVDEINEYFSKQSKPGLNTSKKDTIYVVYMNRNRYVVSNVDGSVETSCYYEFDIKNDCFTDKKWDFSENDHIESFPVFKQEDIPVNPIEQPKGKLVYLEPILK